MSGACHSAQEVVEGVASQVDSHFMSERSGAWPLSSYIGLLQAFDHMLTLAEKDANLVNGITVYIS